MTTHYTAENLSPWCFIFKIYILGLYLFFSFLCLSSRWLWITELWLPNWIAHKSDASVIPWRRNKWGAVASGVPSHRTGVGPLLAGGPFTDSFNPPPPFISPEAPEWRGARDSSLGNTNNLLPERSVWASLTVKPSRQAWRCARTLRSCWGGGGG